MIVQTLVGKVAVITGAAQGIADVSLAHCARRRQARVVRYRRWSSSVRHETEDPVQAIEILADRDVPRRHRRHGWCARALRRSDIW